MRLVISNGERDRRLLAVTCAVGAFALSVRFLLWPAFTRGRELKQAIEAASAGCAERRARISALAGLDGAAARRGLVLEAVSGPYYKPMAAWEMDALITGLALKHGLIPERLTLTGAAPGTASPYLSQPEPDGTEETEDYIQVANAQLEAGGEAARWQDFLDDVAWNYPGLRVTGFEVVDRAAGPEAPASGGGFRCGLEIYMCGEADGG